MVLKLYNTLTRTKEEFRPLDPKNVRMYVCGPTVYDFAHIGNARPVIVFDVLFRLLRHLAKQGVWDGGKGETKVTYVRNITDVDDKINARAAEIATEQKIPIEQARAELTERTTKQFHEDVAALGALPPTYEPRATEHISHMIAMITQLIASGHAYPAEGHVLYDVSSKPDYGKLSRRSLDEMIAGARVEVAPYKRNPMDFVLWKPSKEGEPSWPSPWSNGRPGWHIECSAMSEALLGETFDIHGGGIDLVFPHHENEIAQSEAVHAGHPFACVWMHNGFLQVEGEKMSKSLGNFFTIREILETKRFGGREWPGTIVRLAMLMSHYRQPIDWSLDRLQEAQSRRIRWLGPPISRGLPEKGRVSEEMVAALMDDLDTTAALSVLDELRARARSPVEPVPANVANDLATSMLWLGIAEDSDFAEARADSEHLKETIRAAAVGVDLDFVQMRIAARNEARKAKNFKESDRIRDELAAKGIVLKDGPTGTTWEVKR